VQLGLKMGQRAAKSVSILRLLVKVSVLPHEETVNWEIFQRILQHDLVEGVSSCADEHICHSVGNLDGRVVHVYRKVVGIRTLIFTMVLLALPSQVIHKVEELFLGYQLRELCFASRSLHRWAKFTWPRIEQDVCDLHEIFLPSIKLTFKL